MDRNATLEASGTEEEKTAWQTRVCNGTWVGETTKMFWLADGPNMTPTGFAIRVPFAVACFIFGPGHLLRDIPFDPHLAYLYQGEEILMNVRMFTSGFDVYAPVRQVVYHRYTDEPGNIAHTREHNVYKEHDRSLAEQKGALARVAYLLGISKKLPPQNFRKDMDMYGLGKVRSTFEWAEWSGVNLTDPTIVTAGDKFCIDDIPMNKDRLCPITHDARQRFNAANAASQ